MLPVLEVEYIVGGLILIHYTAFMCFQDSEQYVEKLLELFNRFSRLVKEAFKDDPRFLTARDKVNCLFRNHGVYCMLYFNVRFFIVCPTVLMKLCPCLSY